MWEEQATTAHTYADRHQACTYSTAQQQTHMHQTMQATIQAATHTPKSVVHCLAAWPAHLNPIAARHSLPPARQPKRD